MSIPVVPRRFANQDRPMILQRPDRCYKGFRGYTQRNIPGQMKRQLCVLLSIAPLMRFEQPFAYAYR